MRWTWLLCAVLLTVGCAGEKEKAETPRGPSLSLRADGAPRLVFRNTDTVTPGGFGHVAQTADGGVTRTLGEEKCERVYAAAGTGICLTVTSGRNPQAYARILDGDFAEKRSIPVDGTPNRARVSPSGNFAAWTTFVYGDSYAATSFSTRTMVVDTRGDEPATSLEEYEVVRGAAVVREPDRNFWGVTFATDDRTFYATMGLTLSGKTFLIRGDLQARTAVVVRENTECPSLSPDGTRIVFKKKVSADRTQPWRLHVLDLKTMKETPLAETRSVDDQVEWLDDTAVAYALPRGTGADTDVWTVKADGGGAPEKLVAGAYSPVLVR